jgi:hypothetical protein
MDLVDKRTNSIKGKINGNDINNAMVDDSR